MVIVILYQAHILQSYDICREQSKTGGNELERDTKDNLFLNHLILTHWLTYWPGGREWLYCSLLTDWLTDSLTDKWCKTYKNDSMILLHAYLISWYASFKGEKEIKNKK